MKVQLINVAEYDIKEGKSSEVPFSTFVALCGGNVGNTGKDYLPKVRLFKTMGEFISLSSEEMSEIDQEENIRILSNGQFLVFLKSGNKEKNIKSAKSNATADTKENQGE